MRVGDEFRLDAIGVSDFVKVGRRLQIPAGEAADRVHHMRSQLAAAIDEAAAIVHGDEEGAIARKLAGAIAGRADERGWSTGL